MDGRRWKHLWVFILPLGLVACGGAAGSGGGGQNQNHGSGDLHSVQHIIFMFQENRSFDSYFGKLNSYRTSKGLSADVDDLSTVSPAQSANPAWDGSGDIQPFQMVSACSEDITPSWNESHLDRNPSKPASTTATMNGFAREAGGYAAHTGLLDVAGKRAMGYYDQTQLPYYYFMATQFATSDRFFSPMMSKSEPNHLYSYAATSAGWITVPQGQLSVPTIFNLLQNAGISWKIYYTDVVTSTKSPDVYASYFSKLAPYSSNIVPLDNYFTDLQNGTLPAVALIEAGRDSGLDEHPDNNVQKGAVQAASVVNALMASSSWSSSVFILTWDEGGGVYDHVPPQTTVNPDGIPPNTVADPNDPNTFGDNFTYTGFRLPLIVASPFAKSGYVSHTPMDYTAILKLIETRFGLTSLTARDAAQPDMTEFFDFAGAPNLAPPSPPAQPTNAPCYKDHLP
jgi:phospholipase C